MIHVLLPVHNRAAVTAVFAQSLAAQDVVDWRLWLIDDGCTDDTVARVSALVAPSHLRVLSGSGNLWWAGALQLGFETLVAERIDGDDTVLICNDDMQFEPDFLRRGLEVLADHPQAAIQAVGRDALTGSIDRGAIADMLRFDFRAATAAEQPNCLSTRGLIMRAAVFLHSGGLRPAQLPHYMSDYEFTLRLARQGAPLLCDDRFHAVVRLELTGSSGYRRDSLSAFWAAAFSNRAKNNPAHMTAFVAMACPWWIAPLHVARIWFSFLRAALRAAAHGGLSGSTR